MFFTENDSSSVFHRQHAFGSTPIPWTLSLERVDRSFLAYAFSSDCMKQRQRKTLHYETPAERFSQCVALTD